MKVVSNTFYEELSGEMISVNRNYQPQKFTWKLPKVTPF